MGSLQGENLFYVYLAICALVVGIFLVRRYLATRGYKKSFGHNQSTGTGTGTQQNQTTQVREPNRKLRKQVQKLVASNHIQAAARLFEGSGFANEAATILTKYGMFDDALKAYLRAQNLQGAGNLLARLGKYEDAIPYFERCKAYSDAAMCAVQLQKWDISAHYFLQSQRYSEAIYCMVKQGMFQNALELSRKIRDAKQYADVFLAFAKEKPEEFSQMEVQADDLRTMAEAIQKGSAPLGFIYSMDAQLGMHELIFDYIRNGKEEPAVVLCKALESKQIYRKLIDNASYVDKTGELIGDFLLNINQLEFAAEAYIRSQSFLKASAVYEKLGDFKRAIDAALSAQDWDHADHLRKKLQEKADHQQSHRREDPPERHIPAKNGIFALEDSAPTPAVKVEPIVRIEHVRPNVASPIREFGDSKEAPAAVMHDDISFEINSDSLNSDQVFQINLGSKKTGSK